MMIVRILKSLKRYDESMKVCDRILRMYPNNTDILFEKASNLLYLGKNNECLEFLNSVTNMSNKFKIKIRNSKLFEQLQKNENFVKLLE